MKKYRALFIACTLFASGNMQAKNYPYDKPSKKMERVESQEALDAILKEHKIVLYAVHGIHWCGACQASWNGLNKFADSTKIKVVDTDIPAGFSGPAAKLASAYHVHGVPTFILFKDGEEVARRSGVIAKKKEYVKWVKKFTK